MSGANVRMASSADFPSRYAPMSFTVGEELQHVDETMQQQRVIVGDNDGAG